MEPREGFEPTSMRDASRLTRERGLYQFGEDDVVTAPAVIARAQQDHIMPHDQRADEPPDAERGQRRQISIIAGVLDGIERWQPHRAHAPLAYRQVRLLDHVKVGVQAHAAKWWGVAGVRLGSQIDQEPSVILH